MAEQQMVRRLGQSEEPGTRRRGGAVTEGGCDRSGEVYISR